MPCSTSHRRGFMTIIIIGASFFLTIAVWSQQPGTGKQQAGALPVVSGYFQPGLSLDSDGTGTFYLKRARFSAAAALPGPVSWKVQAECAGTPKLLDAVLRLQVLPGLTFTAGQFKIPVSRENLLSSGSLITISRSRIVEGLTARSGDPLGNQNGRDIGISLEGGITRRQRSVLTYSVALLNGSGINRTDTDRWKDLAARITGSPWPALTLAVSSYFGHHRFDDSETSGTERGRIGADIAWTPGSCLFVAEYLQGRDGGTEQWGWYLLGRFPLAGERLAGVFKLDRFAASGSSPGDRWTLGLSWRIDPRTRVLCNCTFTERDIRTRSCGTMLVMLQTGF